MHKHSLAFLLAVFAVCTYVPLQGKGQVGTLDIKGAHLKFLGPILGFDMDMISPRDVATGMASGKRQHSPIVVHRGCDGSTPNFLQAVGENEVLQTVVIQLTRSGQKGGYMMVKLTNATISGFHVIDGTASANTKFPDGQPVEEISLTYQKIEITFVDSKTSFTDDWQAQ